MTKILKKYPTLKLVPPELLTPEVCMLYVNHGGLNLQFVPAHLKTSEMCLNAINKNHRALNYFPKELMTSYEICYLIVKACKEGIYRIPDNFKTKEMYNYVMENNGNLYLRFIPDNLKTYEICMYVVKKNGYELEFVPDNLKTYELCFSAVNESVCAIQYIPDCHKTYEMYLNIVTQNSHLLEYIPEYRKSYEMCLNAVKHNSKALKFVPEILKTPEICFIAFEQECYEYIPIKYFNTTFLHEIITNKEDDCSVCMINEGTWCKLECNHQLHLDCMTTILQSNKRCPFCMKNIDLNRVWIN